MQSSLFQVPSPPKVKRVRPRGRVTQINADILAKINQRQRQVLIHSHLYYVANENVVSDAQYDKWAHELYDLMQTYPKEAKKSAWAREFKDYDGNTGMGLPLEDPWVVSTAQHLLEIRRTYEFSN